MKDLAAALGRLDDETRTLVRLSYAHRQPDEEVGRVLRVDADEVERRRTEAFDRLAADLGLDGREQRDELFATLPDLPASYWDRS